MASENCHPKLFQAIEQLPKIAGVYLFKDEQGNAKIGRYNDRGTGFSVFQIEGRLILKGCELLHLAFWWFICLHGIMLHLLFLQLADDTKFVANW